MSSFDATADFASSPKISATTQAHVKVITITIYSSCTIEKCILLALRLISGGSKKFHAFYFAFRKRFFTSLFKFLVSATAWNK